MKKILLSLFIFCAFTQLGFAASGQYSNAEFGIGVEYPTKWSLLEDKNATMLQLLISPEKITSTDDLGNINDYLMTVAVIKDYKASLQSYIDLEIEFAKSKGDIIASPDDISINGKKWKKYKYLISNLVTTKYVSKDTGGNLNTISIEESQPSLGKYDAESENIIKSIAYH